MANPVCHIIIITGGNDCPVFKINEHSGITAGLVVEKLCNGCGYLCGPNREQLGKDAILAEGQHYFLLLTPTPFQDGVWLKIGATLDVMSEALGSVWRCLWRKTEANVTRCEEEISLIRPENV